MAQESWNCDAADGSGCQQQEGRVLCINNCGFLGCASTLNMCAKCYGELSLKQPETSTFSASEITMAALEDKSMLPKAAVEMAAIIQVSRHTDSASERSQERITEPSPLSLNALPRDGLESGQMSASFGLVLISSSATMAAKDPLLMSPPATMTTDGTCTSRFCASSSSSQQHKADLTSIAARLSSKFDVVGGPAISMRRHSVSRCLTCKKRTGLLGFKCRCGNVFCASHRYSDKHGCPFDYRAAAKDAIAKANPIVKASKVQKI